MTRPDLDSAGLRRLRDLLDQPSAPFHEDLVRRWVAAELAAAGAACCDDPAGNLLVGVASSADYRRILRTPGAPLVLLIAHMDHPGFHGQRWLAPNRLAVRWHGGGPRRHLAGKPVWLADAGTTRLAGTLHRPRVATDGSRLERAEVVLDGPLSRRPAARSLFGGWSFGPRSWTSGKRVYARAADDLVGVFAILETARRLARRRTVPGAAPLMLGLLTRAEEVGFLGMLAHLEHGWLQDARRPLLCVSLEASSQRPGARSGGGPVVRLGDRFTVFSALANRRIARLAGRLLPGHHQARLMDGGVCEASATLVHGLDTAGLAVPLGNYHNQNLDGGQRSGLPDGPAPEFVDRRDVAGLVALCHGLVSRPWEEDPWRVARARLHARRRRHRRLLARPLQR